MSKALEMLMADKLAAREDEGRTQGRAEGRTEERRDLLSRLQESGMITADQAATAMGWSF